MTRPCAVTIARAPDDVRIVVDAWIAAEPSCSTALEVRIVPTEGGLYLLARDEHGRVRERIVPDAQSAGVLIASWAADDVIVAPPVTPAPAPEPAIAPAPPPEAPPAAPAVAPPAPMAPSMMGPSMAPGALGGPVDGPPAPSLPKRISKWISVGALVGDSGASGGARLELDIFTRGKWSFGLAGSVSNARTWVYANGSGGELMTSDKKLTATVTRNMQYGRFQLRASAGLGLVYSEAGGLMTSYAVGASSDIIEGDDVFSVADASLLLGIELGKSWAITGGPVLTIYDQVFDAHSVQMTWEPTPAMTVSRQTVEVMGYMGLRYRL
ncbi:MAG: hypothetical protein HOV81_05380 [Kofleriaceae bacterium]|nr:hypothetical protein [Kofleriaceae bacterium]